MATEHSTAATRTGRPDTDPPAETTFRDGDGRRLSHASRRPPAGELDALAVFYDGFDAADRAQGIPPASPERRASWLDALLENATVDTVVRDGARVVGHATLVEGPPGQPHELTVFVDADYRGAGLGSELLDALLSAGAAAGVEAAELTVEHGNHAARRLYERHDFEIVERGPFVLEMEREL
jgi:ribosomal protein S18 acetylase RimI-like enzyme